MADGADGFTFRTGEKSQLIDAFRLTGTTRVGDYTVKYGVNGLVTGLHAVEYHLPDTSIYYTLWCSAQQSINSRVSERDFFIYILHKDFWITSSAVRKILAWRPAEEPEPPPEPEKPDPIEEGNGILDGVIANMTAWIRDAILAGLAFLEEPLNLIKDIIGKVGNAISTFASTLEASISTIMAKVTGMFETIAGKISGVINQVWNNIELIWETLKDVYDTIKTAIVTAFKTTWEFIKQTFTTLWDKMKEGLKWIADGIVSGIKFLWEKIKDGLNWAGTVLNTAYKALKDTVTAIWERTKQRLTDTIDSIKESFGDAIDRLKDFFLWLWEKITAIFDKVFDMSEEAIEEMGYRVLSVQKRILERFVQAEGIT